MNIHIFFIRVTYRLAGNIVLGSIKSMQVNSAVAERYA